jgi:hypothetical protein
VPGFWYLIVLGYVFSSLFPSFAKEGRKKNLNRRKKKYRKKKSLSSVETVLDSIPTGSTWGFVSILI